MTPRKTQDSQSERCVLYCRVSTLRQKKEGLSLDAQEDLCIAYAKNNRFDVGKIFKEDESASISERKKFNEMLDWMKTMGIKHLVVEKMDRYHRDMKGENIIKDNKLTVHLVKDGMICNWKASSAFQKFIFRVQSAQTAWVADNTSEEAIKGIRKRLERGEIVQHVPLGYLNDIKKHTARKDLDKFDLVRKIWDLALTGKHSLEELAKIANSIGLTSKSGKPLGKSDIHRILTNPFYYGMIPWKGKEVEWGRELWPNTGINNDRPPSYPTLITKAEFHRVQEILSGRRNNWSTKRGRDYLFKGIFKCAQCGRTLLGEPKTVELKSGEEKEIIFYHCTKGQYFVNKEGSPVWKHYVDTKNLVIKEDISHPEEVRPGEVHEIITSRKGDRVQRKICAGIVPWLKEEDLKKEILNNISFITNPKAMDILKEKLGESVQELTDTTKDQMRYLKKRKTEIDGMIERLWERSLKPDFKVKEEDFQFQLDRLTNERDDIKVQLRELEDANDASVDDAIEIIELSKSFKTKYLAADMNTQRRMLKKIYRTIYVSQPNPDLPFYYPMHFIYNEPFETFVEEGMIEIDREQMRQIYPQTAKSKKWLLG